MRPKGRQEKCVEYCRCSKPIYFQQIVEYNNQQEGVECSEHERVAVAMGPCLDGFVALV